MITSLVAILVLAAPVVLLVRFTELALSLRSRILRRGVAGLLAEPRLRRAPRSGEGRAEIRARSRRDAERMLVTALGRPANWIDARFLGAWIRARAPDLAKSADGIQRRFGELEPALGKRFGLAARLIALGWSIALVVFLRFWFPTGGAGGAATSWPSGLLVVTPGSSAWTGVPITALLVTLAAAGLYRPLRALIGDGRVEAARVAPAEVEAGGTIGREGRTVRAINFSGGGFDTFMQLGVTHALMVLQGRPPDAVVGVSAGAVQAAALAEVLQAGEELEPRDGRWEELEPEAKVELQRRRMEARVARFREFLSACHVARERLFDSVTPDAYQVGTHAPLEPLRTPLFDPRERAAREQSLRMESGLVRLYNDLLNLDLPLGFLSRLLRRLLGLRAAGALPGRMARLAARSREVSKIWLLLGGPVVRLRPILARLLRAFSTGKPKPVRPASAESLLFRFGATRELAKALQWAFGSLVCMALWVGLGVWPAAIVLLALEGQSPFRTLFVLLVLYLLAPPLLVLLFRRSGRAAVEAARGTFEASWLLAKWIAVLLGSAAVLLGSAVLAVWARGAMAQWWEAGAGGGGGAHGQWPRLTPENLDAALRGTLLVCAGVAALVVAVGFALVLLRRLRDLRRALRGERATGRGGFLRRLLASYDLCDALFHSHAIRTFLVQHFDRHYFGRMEMDDVVAESMRASSGDLSRRPAGRKRVSHYSSSQRSSPIHLGLAVANVLDGELEVVPGRESVVDGLVAACSVSPLFGPARIGDALYVDGANVANVPTRALLSMLRNRIHRGSHGVLIYSVVPLPLGREALYESEDRGPLLHLLDVLRDALFLRRFRDATVERSLTELYTKVIPRTTGRGEPNFGIEVGGGEEARYFFRARVLPIELEEPTTLNERILTAAKGERREAIARTVADGCRAALETMTVPTSFDTGAGDVRECSRVMRRHLRWQAALARLPEGLATAPLPGSGPLGPGLHEVCRHCALNRGTSSEARQALRMKRDPPRTPWPHERFEGERPAIPEPAAEVGCGRGEHPSAEPPGTSSNGGRTRESGHGPEPSAFTCPDGWPGGQPGRPTISLLFSGGVFRGVYQLGVANALHELEVKPDLIAGASVGSITGAMVRRAFGLPSRRERRARLARLAAVYLGMDRFILTDRFADFVRNLTVRAAETRVSLRQADRLFRTYDYPRSARFGKAAREVVAGVERLLYVNPYQLDAVVRAARNRDLEAVLAHGRELVQQWLDRMEVGDQVLGSEALVALIEHFVVAEAEDDSSARPPSAAQTAAPIVLLAMATNLTRGYLETIAVDSKSPTLAQVLLASSAFPVVFRPRWSWELDTRDRREAQYLDGGLIDNFPIGPAIRFLAAAERACRIEARPHGQDGGGRPHLIFAASLEPDPPELHHLDEWAYLEHDWPRLLARSRELAYNHKLDTFTSAELHLREIHDQILRDASDGADGGGRARPGSKGAEGGGPLLDLEVVCVKPKWLCGTFAFHPMLGFRRANQAKSIAHGCATTLLRFARVEDVYREAWRMSGEIPGERGFGRAWEAWRRWRKRHPIEAESSCWLRPGVRCPFARASLDQLNAKLAAAERPTLDETIVREVATIHGHCADPSTHQPGATDAGPVLRALRRIGWAP